MSRLQTLPNELFVHIIELVMAEGERVDFRQFARDAEQLSSIAHPRRNGPCSVDAFSQLEPHMKDWFLAISGNTRLKAVAKAAFFRSKIFLLSLTTAGLLQALIHEHLSREDQEVARACITSVMIMMGRLDYPSTFLSLPIRLRGFHSLRQVDLSLGFAPDWEIAFNQGVVREAAPSDLVDLLSLAGVNTSTLAILVHIHGKSESDTLENYEESLRKNVYLLLKAFTNKFDPVQG